MSHNLYIETVGCQMNMLDSEMVVADLRKRGYELTSDVKAADTILYNTCSVRAHAEDKIYSALGTLKLMKNRNPDKIIGVMGFFLIFTSRRRQTLHDMLTGTIVRQTIDSSEDDFEESFESEEPEDEEE